MSEKILEWDEKLICQTNKQTHKSLSKMPSLYDSNILNPFMIKIKKKTTFSVDSKCIRYD